MVPFLLGSLFHNIYAFPFLEFRVPHFVSFLPILFLEPSCMLLWPSLHHISSNSILISPFIVPSFQLFSGHGSLTFGMSSACISLFTSSLCSPLKLPSSFINLFLILFLSVISLCSGESAGLFILLVTFINFSSFLNGILTYNISYTFGVSW